MTEPTLLWHDYETFGLDPRMDRPAQFAAVRTTLDLQELEVVGPIYAKPPLDYLPDPGSVLITGISPQYAQAHGLTEAEFARQIDAQMQVPATISVGYNSKTFDDEVTRHLFWRNLRDPYAREWKHQCSRWDLIDVVRCTWALRPAGINWPTSENDPKKPSFKLTDLTAANGLSHEDAHDALSDVRATIAIAKLLKSTNPRLFDYALRSSSKTAVRFSINRARDSLVPLLHVASTYGTDNGCLAPLWPLAPNPFNPNEYICWNLRQDPSDLCGLTAEQVRSRLFSKQADMEEGTSRLGLHSLASNRCPLVMVGLGTLSPDLAQKWQIDPQLCSQRIQQLVSMARSLAELWEAVYAGAVEAQGEPEAQLYNGFLGKLDQAQLGHMQKWSAADWKQRPFESFDIFLDPRIQELAWRYMCRNYPEVLTPAEQRRWTLQCADRLFREEPLPGYQARTFATFEASLAQIVTTDLSPAQLKIIADVAHYGQKLKERLTRAG